MSTLVDEMGEAGDEECPSCALPVDRQEHPDVCPYCHYEYPKQKPMSKVAAVLFIVLMVLFILWGVL